MGTPPRLFRNPFLDAPASDPLRSYQPLTARETIALTRAPRSSAAGTQVTMWATPVGKIGGAADHMFEVFDDGREQLIARGGPSAEGAAFIEGALGRSLTIRARVDPAERSPDYRQGQRVVAQGFLPGMSAREATAGARRHAAKVNQGANAYTPWRNSNSFAADDFESLFGRRVGDSRTWGYRTRLREEPPLPDLSGVTPNLARMISTMDR